MKRIMMMLCFMSSLLFMQGCGVPAEEKNAAKEDPKKAVQFNYEHVLGLPMRIVYAYEVTNLSKDKELTDVYGMLVKKNSFGGTFEEQISFSNIPAGKTKFFAIEKAENGLSKNYEGDSLDDILKQMELDPEQYYFRTTETTFKVKEASFK